MDWWTITYLVGAPFFYGYAYTKFNDEGTDDRIVISLCYCFLWPLVMPFDLAIDFFRYIKGQPR